MCDLAAQQSARCAPIGEQVITFEEKQFERVHCCLTICSRGAMAKPCGFRSSASATRIVDPFGRFCVHFGEIIWQPAKHARAESGPEAITIKRVKPHTGSTGLIKTYVRTFSSKKNENQGSAGVPVNRTLRIKNGVIPT